MASDTYFRVYNDSAIDQIYIFSYGFRIRNHAPAHEANRSYLAFTLPPVNEDVFSGLFHTK